MLITVDKWQRSAAHLVTLRRVVRCNLSREIDELMKLDYANRRMCVYWLPGQQSQVAMATVTLDDGVTD